MKITYFHPMPETLEQLKSTYKELAMKNHPDCGGDTEIMKSINNEYDSLFPLLKNTHMNKDGECYTSTKPTQETPNAWKDIINALIGLNMKGVLIEIIGSFVWISGNTKPYKDDLKEMGYRWSKNKVAWYLAPEGYRKHSKRNFQLDDIRSMYGTMTINTNSNIAYLSA